MKILTLEGSIDGMIKLFEPDYSKLFSLKVWSDASNFGFYVFLCGVGINQSLASFRERKQKIFSPSLWIPLITVITHIFASLIVFGFLGYYIKQKNITYEDVAISGPDLLFITYPEIINTLPWPNLWNIIFFLTIVLLGIDSQFAMVDVIIYFVKDFGQKYNGKELTHSQATLLVCIVEGLFGVSMCTQCGYYLIIVSFNYVFRVTAALGNVLNVYIFVYNTDYKILFEKMGYFNNEKTPRFYTFLLEYVNIWIYGALCINGIYFLLFEIDVGIPNWMHYLGLSMILLQIIPILVQFLLNWNNPINKDPYTKIFESILMKHQKLDEIEMISPNKKRQNSGKFEKSQKKGPILDEL